jgi:hypothetical protein
MRVFTAGQRCAETPDRTRRVLPEGLPQASLAVESSHDLDLWKTIDSDLNRSISSDA